MDITARLDSEFFSEKSRPLVSYPKVKCLWIFAFHACPDKVYKHFFQKLNEIYELVLTTMYVLFWKFFNTKLKSYFSKIKRKIDSPAVPIFFDFRSAWIIKSSLMEQMLKKNYETVTSLLRLITLFLSLQNPVPRYF